MVDLLCRNCNVEFEKHEDKFICQKCSAVVRIENKIICFSTSEFYNNIISREMMHEYLHEIRTLGWAHAYYALQERSKPMESKAIFENMMLPKRAGWKFLLPIDKSARVLDLGSGWGATTINMARSCGEVTAYDLTKECLESLREMARNERLDNISYVHADDNLDLPFRENYFDIVIINGVMEWVPEAQDGNPEIVQLRFLKEVGRVLRSRGVIYMTIGNRFSYTYFSKSEDHAQLVWGSLMPKAMSNNYSLYKRKKPYRVYTYSYSGYKRLFRRAGFQSLDRYALLPNYRYPAQIIDLENNCQISDEVSPHAGWKKRVKMSIPFLRLFSHSFGHVISLQARGNRIPGFLTVVVDELQKRNNLEELKCVKYMMRSFCVLAFCRNSKGREYSCVIRLPYGENEVRRAKVNVESLRELNGKKLIVGSNRIQVPEVLFDDSLNGQYVSAETWIQGIDINQIEIDPNKVSHQLNLFLIGLGKLTLDKSEFSKQKFSQFMRNISADISPKILNKKNRHRFEQIVNKLLPKVDQLRLPLVCAHGDFNMGNSIWDIQKETLTGIIDWDQTVTCGLPGWDLLNILSKLRINQGQSWIDSLVHLAEEKWNDTEMELWAMYADEFDISWEMRTTLVWSLWLKGIWEGCMMNMSLNFNWLAENFDPILDRLPGKLDSH